MLKSVKSGNKSVKKCEVVKSFTQSAKKLQRIVNRRKTGNHPNKTFTFCYKSESKS